jgi:hypothetical protein
MGMNVKVFRTIKPLTAVEFDSEGHGHFVILPYGSEITISGKSVLADGVEILCAGGRYHVFKQDLLGNVVGRWNDERSSLD